MMARVVSLEETDNSILMRGMISLLLISHKACVPTLVETFNTIIEDRNGCYHSYKYLCVGLKEMMDTPPIRLIEVTKPIKIVLICKEDKVLSLYYT